jgi:hypothetical protein
MILVLFTMARSFAVEADKPQDPAELLTKVHVFAFGGIGFAGMTSDGERAFDAILATTNALPLFETVLRSGSPEGRLYALCGIRQLAQAKFDSAAKLFRSDKSKVRTVSGCLAFDEPVCDIVARIALGSYDRRTRPAL